MTLGSIESFFRSRSDLKDKVDIVTYRRYRGYLDVHRDLYAARRSQIASRLKLNRESQPYPVTAVIFRRRTRRWGRSLNAAGLNGPLAAWGAIQRWTSSHFHLRQLCEDRLGK